VAGIVIGISRPRESVVRHLVPFLARDLARFAADAHGRIREEADLYVIVHEGMFPLIRALDSFTDHRLSMAEFMAAECMTNSSGDYLTRADDLVSSFYRRRSPREGILTQII
jgi:hypothetical protein